MSKGVLDADGFAAAERIRRDGNPVHGQGVSNVFRFHQLLADVN
jgi:hypothetical protein